jgi:hypothetical protein
VIRAATMILVRGPGAGQREKWTMGRAIVIAFDELDFFCGLRGLTL